MFIVQIVFIEEELLYYNYCRLTDDFKRIQQFCNLRWFQTKYFMLKTDSFELNRHRIENQPSLNVDTVLKFIHGF